jgi:hypothetical protein
VERFADPTTAALGSPVAAGGLCRALQGFMFVRLLGVFVPAHRDAGDDVGDLLVVRSLAATFTVRFVATVKTCCLMASDSEKQLSDTEPSAVKREAFECSSALLGEATGVMGPTAPGVGSTPSVEGFARLIPLFTLVTDAACGSVAGDLPGEQAWLADVFLPATSLAWCLLSCLPPDWFLCSAASALLMLSCFFHLVRRFWNQIFTCNSQTGRQ